MNQKKISLILWVVITILAYFVVKSPLKQVEFEATFSERKSEVIQSLMDIRTAQVAYKEHNRIYASNFDDLLNFVKKDSIAIIKAIGETPDSLTEEQALKVGIISRDTVFVPALNSIFSDEYLDNRKVQSILDINSLPTVPFSNNSTQFKIEAGQIEKGKVIVQVFEVYTNYGAFLQGLEANNKGVDLESIISVGSMSEASISGNWGE
jgi:hypothetical protein